MPELILLRKSQQSELDLLFIKLHSDRAGQGSGVIDDQDISWLKGVGDMSDVVMLPTAAIRADPQ